MSLTHVWQSRVEIEHLFLAYFDRINAQERKTSVKGGTHMHCVNMSSIHEFTQCVLFPPILEVSR